MDSSIEIIDIITPKKELLEADVIIDEKDDSPAIVCEKRVVRKRTLKTYEESPSTPKRPRVTRSKTKKPRVRPLLKTVMASTNIKRRLSMGSKASKTLNKSKVPKDPFPKPKAAAPRAIKRNKASTSDDIEILFEWNPATVISQTKGVDLGAAKSIVQMFENENTIPFIARYRREQTGNIEVEKLREIQNTYSQLKGVQEKVLKVLKSECGSKIPQDRRQSLMKATTLDEIEHLTAAFKSSGKRTYAERAKEVGLEAPAMEFLQAVTNRMMSRHDIFKHINLSKEGLKTEAEVTQGIQYIIADVVSKEPKVLEFVKQLVRDCRPVLESNRKKTPASSKKTASKISLKSGPSKNLKEKYENYASFSNVAWSVRSHQVMAINRGEKQGVLSVKMVIPDFAYRKFFNFCSTKWIPMHSQDGFRNQIVMNGINDSWERLVKPFMQRYIRSQLTSMAEVASVDVFTSNLKKLLLTSPVRGKMIMAIDPGFHNGCKVAIIDIQGEPLHVTTIYPFRQKEFSGNGAKDWTQDHNAQTLKEIVQKYGTEYVAIGNGTACREMEQFLSVMIKDGCFLPYNVQYTIVNESGASQYSVTPDARQEFPDLDINHISAVSLARRVQDPLLEYVKVHPMHLGVGMYQHDINEKILHSSLDSVMIECVSFVGLDLNVASEFVLRKLSGLNKVRATNIVDHRRTHGPFVNREQLKSVKGIGPRTFEQCAGFVKIMPDTLQEKLMKSPSAKRSTALSCPLDQTVIHPESYEAAEKFMSLVGVMPHEVGMPGFQRKVKEFTRSCTLDEVAAQCGTTSISLQLIVEALTQPLNFDIRAQFEVPLFRKGITSINDLVVGSKVTGTVRNMTHFGAFVDIGVGNNGLLHTSQMNGKKVELGNVVEVVVRDVVKSNGRISLELSRVL